MNQAYQPWFLALMAEPSERPTTAIASAMYLAVEKALYDPRHPLCRQTFGFYGSLEALRAVSSRRSLARTE
jgi:hypothetical protein